MVDLWAADPDTEVVQHTAELRRIIALPRRDWRDGIEDTAARLTDILKTPLGTMVLRHPQAAALLDLGMVGGLFGPLPVGSGKTLFSLLASTVCGLPRTLLLMPASLVDKTMTEMAQLRYHWKLPDFIRILSYECLSRVQHQHALGSVVEGRRVGFWPELIIADEAHKLKAKKSACTRRVSRYMNANPFTKFAAISGTISKRSILDFAHILRWCLKDGTPLPRFPEELTLWADALDERKDQTTTADPGALIRLCNDEERTIWEMQPKKAARMAVQRRINETPGVVATRETTVKAKLIVTSSQPPQSLTLDATFDEMRRTFKTPDGWPIADGLEMFRHSRELALGFYYVWDPRPPQYWLIARSMWAAYSRQKIGSSRTLDSELAVRNWVDGTGDPEGAQLLSDWRDVKDDFVPNTVARWVDDSVLRAAADWASDNEGIIWTEHTCFAQRLSKIARLPYYGRKGISSTGRYIENHPGNGSLIASIASNGTGRNLQRWNKNLLVSMPPNGLQTEQLMGRTHRDGTKHDEVHFHVLVSCIEHAEAYSQAIADCVFVRDLTGAPQKILLAEGPGVAYPAGHGGRWERPGY